MHWNKVSFLLVILGGPYCKETIGAASNTMFTRTLIGITDSLQICVMSRGNSGANGFTWDRKTRECFAINDAMFINDRETYFKSCIFDGTLDDHDFFVLSIKILWICVE